jgi:predicted nucleic acid-binding Zn ribbon protein
MKKSAYKPNIEWRLQRMRKCVVCGNAFPVKNFNKTCSAECSRELYLSQRRKHYVANREQVLQQQRQQRRQRRRLTKCAICGKEFLAKTNDKTCSAECVKAYRKDQAHKYYEANRENWARSDARRRERKRAERVPKFKSCVICGKKFDATGSLAHKRNTCSPEHRLERRRMMERAMYAADLENHRAKARAKAARRRKRLQTSFKHASSISVSSIRQR